MLFRCALDTRHFSFEAFGNTAAEARDVFRAGLIRHKGAASDWIDEATTDATISVIEAGAFYRDGSRVPECEAANEAEREAGASAERAGVMWWNNPHPSGSVAAYEWDKGHTAARRIRDAHK